MSSVTNLLGWAIRSTIPVWTIPTDALNNPAHPFAHVTDGGGCSRQGRWQCRSKVVTVEPYDDPPVSFPVAKIGSAVIAALRADPDVWQDVIRWMGLRREQAGLRGPYDAAQARHPILDEERYDDLEQELAILRRSVERSYSNRAATILIDGATPRPVVEQPSLFEVTL